MEDIIEIEKLLVSAKGITFIGIEFSEKIEIKILENDIYYIIGNDYEDKIGINTKTIEVFSLSFNNMEKTFMNSSFEKLLSYIKKFNEKINLENDNYEEIKRHKITKEIEMEIKKIDKKALNNDNTWWDFILEQVVDGLL